MTASSMATELFPTAASDVLYLVDLSSYVLRAYHAVAPLSSPTGEPTHAVHGTVSMLERLIRERRPVLLAIAMDSGRNTFRTEIYPEYKANRPPAPEDLKVQMKRVESFVRAARIPVLKQQGVEADDLIASYVVRARASGLKVVIVASDKDLMQLVTPEVVLWDTMRNRVFGVDEVQERFGVRVDQLRDYLALTGDSSDNIPGVASVGPKTAKDLLGSFSTLEEVYASLDRIERKSLRQALATHRDQAFLSQRLVTLKSDCPIEIEPRLLAPEPADREALRALFTELGFQQKLSQLEQEPLELPGVGRQPAAVPVETKPQASQRELVLGGARLTEILAQAKTAGRLSVEAFTDNQSPTRGTLVGLSLAVEPERAFYLPLRHRHLGTPSQIPLTELRERALAILNDPDVKKVGLDLKGAAVTLKRAGLGLSGFFFDAGLASYLLDPESRHDRDALVKRELGIVETPLSQLLRRGRGQNLAFDELSVEEALDHAADGAAHALRLERRLRPRLEEEALGRLYDELELPLCRLLAELEERGVLLDVGTLSAIGKDCEAELQRLEKEAHRIAGHEFNIHAPRQLEAILFDELGLKPLKRTKTARSTDAMTLEALSEQHPLPGVILEIRQLAKLKNTYVDTLPDLRDPVTGRVLTSWEQTVAATGRLSSTDPNLQNIPIRSPLGRKIRAAFVAPEGHQLVSADYSQIELRVLAHLSGDEVLLEAFRTGQDIHLRTAMEIFELTEAEVTREHRSRAKAVNFGVIYGQGESGLSKTLGIPRAEASSFIAAYFRRYHGVREFMNRTLDAARAGQVVTTLLGRRRLLPDIGSPNRAQRLAAERIAMNTPIQGSAADILKLSMLALEDPVTPGARMILTVHDELVFEVPDAEVEVAERAIRAKMEGVMKLEVPLLVDVGHGKNWNLAH